MIQKLINNGTIIFERGINTALSNEREIILNLEHNGNDVQNFIDVLKNETGLTFELIGQSPDIQHGMFELRSNQSLELRDKKIHVTTGVREVLHAEFESVLTEFRITTPLEGEPYIRIFFRSQDTTGFVDNLKTSVQIRLFGYGGRIRDIYAEEQNELLLR